MIAAILLAWNLAQLWRDTNSHAATVHGVKAFGQKKYAAAAGAFARANGIAPTAQRAFNLGTAEVAAGNREQGSSTLARAVNDRRFRADALFNRGNSALESKAYDYAIHDYSDVLRLRPGDAAAKRNLEIALARRDPIRRNGGGSHPQRQGSSPRQPQAQRQPAPADQQQSRDRTDEALLRSVQQQEQEELSRMHRARGERLHVGW